jgi:transcriptional regulator with XRE-family HTH domain
MIKANNAPIKKEIGKRFKKFREAIGKTQTKMAEELNVYQSTITNIEVGKTFPGVKYIHYFHKEYNLNSNWLVNQSGELFISDEDKKSSSVSKLNCHVPQNDPRYEKYIELLEMMQVPVIEQVILAKLVEIKALAKNDVDEFRKQAKKRIDL